MSTFQTLLMKEIKEGHDGPTIPESRRVYFQERLKNRFFDFVFNRFLEQQKLGLTQAKLARRIGRKPDVVNRWLAGPSNLTLDTASDLLLGIAAEELEMGSSSLLSRTPVNYSLLSDIAGRNSKPLENPLTTTGGTIEAEVRLIKEAKVA